MIDDGIDSFLVTIDDVEDTGWSACLHHQFRETQRNAGVFFRWFQYEGAAGCDGDPKHPHRDHGGEVKRCDSRSDADWLSHAVNVNAGACTLGVLTLDQVRDTAGKLDNVEAPLNVAVAVCQHLAMFLRKDRPVRLALASTKFLKLNSTRALR